MATHHPKYGHKLYRVVGVFPIPFKKKRLQLGGKEATALQRKFKRAMPLLITDINYTLF